MTLQSPPLPRRSGGGVTGGRSRFYTIGGISLMVSGSLFLAKDILELSMGAPPSGGTELVDWVASRELRLAITNEVFFVASALLVPAVIALYESVAGTHRTHAAAGGGILAVTIPVLFVLAIVHGRLMYPVCDIKAHTPEV